MDTLTIMYWVKKEDIAYIRFLLEAYEGIAVVSTVSSEKDIIAIRVAPGCEKEVADLIFAISQEIDIQKKI